MAIALILSDHNLVNFEVAVSSRLPNAATFKIDRNDRCYYSVSALKNGETKSFTCYRPLVGRYVVIRKQDRKTPLALCEVEVYGENIPPSKLTFSLIKPLIGQRLWGQGRGVRIERYVSSISN
jgi:hypothetical protein